MSSITFTSSGVQQRIVILSPPVGSEPEYVNSPCSAVELSPSEEDSEFDDDSLLPLSSEEDDDEDESLSPHPTNAVAEIARVATSANVLFNLFIGSFPP